MERERKRKRKRAQKAEAASRANNRTIDSKGRDAAAMVEEEVAAEAASPPPTEEEVDEFFAILRRMRVAVKYFEKESGSNGKSDGDEPQSSTAVDEAVDGVKVGGERAAESGGLDLNAVPEVESS